MDFCGHTSCAVRQCIFNYYIVVTELVKHFAGIHEDVVSVTRCLQPPKSEVQCSEGHVCLRGLYTQSVSLHAVLCPGS